MHKNAIYSAIVLCTLLAAPAVLAQGSDTCATAQAITSCTASDTYTGPFAFDNSAATNDGDDTHGACNFIGGRAIDNDVWFCWTSEFAGDTVTAETCGSTTIDTKMAVYGPFPDCGMATAACPPGDPDLVACNDDFCGVRSSITFATPSAGEAYLIRVGSFPGTAGGTGALDIACTVPVELTTFSID